MPIENIQSAARLDVARILAETGHLEDAMRSVTPIQNTSDKAFALVELAGVLSAKNRTKQLDILTQVRGMLTTLPAEKHAVILATVAASYAKAGEIASASAVVVDMDNIARAQPSETARQAKAEADRAVAMAQAQSGDLKGALATLSAIGGGYFHASGLAEIAVLQFGNGDRGGAMRTARVALQMASAIVEPYSKAGAFQAVAEAESKIGEQGAASRTFLQARQTVTMKGDERFTTEALMEIARGQMRSHDIQGALQTVRAIRPMYVKYRTVQEIAQIEATAGDVSGLLSWVATQTSSITKAYALVGAAEGMAQVRRQEKGVTTSSR